MTILPGWMKSRSPHGYPNPLNIGRDFDEVRLHQALFADSFDAEAVGHALADVDVRLVAALKRAFRRIPNTLPHDWPAQAWLYGELPRLTLVEALVLARDCRRPLLACALCAHFVYPTNQGTEPAMTIRLAIEMMRAGMPREFVVSLLRQDDREDFEALLDLRPEQHEVPEPYSMRVGEVGVQRSGHVDAVEGDISRAGNMSNEELRGDLRVDWRDCDPDTVIAVDTGPGGLAFVKAGDIIRSVPPVGGV